MGKIENDELRKIKNSHFIRAFEYVAQRKEMNQTQLASAIGSKTAYISVYRNGTRPVPEETIDALVRISATIEKGKGQIYKPSEWTTNVDVRAKDADGKTVGHALISGAPFLRNRVTDYSGSLFTSGGAYTMSLNTDWTTSYTGTW